MKKYEKPHIVIEILATTDLLATSNTDVEKDAGDLDF